MTYLINRRRFFANAAASASGLAMGAHLLGFTSKPSKADRPRNLMEKVMGYRKIDSHAHVSFSEDSPATQMDYADRLGIGTLLISRPMAPGSKGTPEEFIKCNNLVLDAVKKHP